MKAAVLGFDVFCFCIDIVLANDFGSLVSNERGIEFQGFSNPQATASAYY
jgi:hypothetical protein